MPILPFYSIFRLAAFVLTRYLKAALVHCYNVVNMLMKKIKHTETEKCRKTLILGIGNPILRDDRIGHLLVKELRGHISSPNIELRETSLAGLNLAELLAGFDSAIIIDAIQTGGTPGAVYCLKPDDFGSPKVNQNDQHSMGLLSALELGKSLGWPMPQDVTIVAIEAGDAGHFGDDLTPEVEKAIPVALEKIQELLHAQVKESGTTQSVAAGSNDY